jgi:hypothetical protein
MNVYPENPLPALLMRHRREVSEGRRSGEEWRGVERSGEEWRATGPGETVFLKNKGTGIKGQENGVENSSKISSLSDIVRGSW